MIGDGHRCRFALENALHDDLASALPHLAEAMTFENGANFLAG